MKPKKFVEPSVYTREYYFTDCTGFSEFNDSYGDKLEPRFQEIVKYFTVYLGMRILDVGCGRGELVLYAARHGAEATGIDYATEAVKLANAMKRRKEKNIKERMKFYLMNAKELAFPESYFDVVIMTDVVEHLYDEELHGVFNEIKRVLKKDGTLILHTAPNKLFFDIGYRLYSYPISGIVVALWNIITRSKYPSIQSPDSLRTSSHAIMHVNEPTYFSLKKLLWQHNFVGKLISTNVVSKKPLLGIKDRLFNAIVYLHPLSMHFPFNILLGSDFIGVLRNRK